MSETPCRLPCLPEEEESCLGCALAFWMPEEDEETEEGREAA